MTKLVSSNLLFEITDILGKRIRTSRSYWHKIKTQKHRELKYGLSAIKQTLRQPKSIYRSVKDATINLYYRDMKGDTLVVVIKQLNGEGFLVTAYQTKDPKEKGERLWPM